MSDGTGRPRDDIDAPDESVASPPSALLVRRWRAGDLAAFDQLVERIVPGLRAFARLNMGPLLRAREGASDIVQSSLRRVVERLPELDFASEAEFRAYVYRSALHRILEGRQYHDAARRTPRRESGELEVVPEAVVAAYSAVASPSGQAISREEIARFEAAFDELEPDQREVLSLRRIAGLSLRQVAAHLDIEYARARNLLGKATARLSLLLGEDGA